MKERRLGDWVEAVYRLPTRRVPARGTTLSRWRSGESDVPPWLPAVLERLTEEE